MIASFTARSMWTAVLLTLLVLALPGCGSAPDEDTARQDAAQQTAPAAPAWTPDSLGAQDALLDSEAMLQVLADLKGKVVIINFWATWCGPCREEIPLLKTLRGKFSGDEVFLLGASVDQDPSAFKRFAAQAGFNYPVRRISQDAAMMYRVQSIPKLMVYTPKGSLAWVHNGLDKRGELEEVVQRLLAGEFGE